jgi:hypothetical protein
MKQRLIQSCIPCHALQYDNSQDYTAVEEDSWVAFDEVALPYFRLKPIPISGGIMANKKQQKKDPNVTVAVITAVSTVAIAIIGGVFALLQRQSVTPSEASTVMAPTSGAVSPSPTNSPDYLASQLWIEAQNWDLVPNIGFLSDAWKSGPITEVGWSGTMTITATGVYQIAVNYLGKDSDAYWIIPTIGGRTNFYLSVEGKYVEGADHNTYGLMFRLSGTDGPGYLFRLYERERRYEIDTYDTDWTPLQKETPSEYIHPGAFNRLSVIAQGPELYFYINDEFVRHLTNDQFNQGVLGLRVYVNKGMNHIYEFNNFILREPSK